MILDSRSDLSIQPLGPGWIQRLTTDRFVAIWAGVVFLYGLPPGGPSLGVFLQDLEISRLRTETGKLRGSFFLAIQEKSSMHTFAFTDNSGLFKAYRSPTRISDSYLEIIASEGVRVKDLDIERIVEFLELGNVHFERTFVSSIKKFQHDDIVTFCKERRTCKIEKALPTVSTRNDVGLEEVFAQLARSFEAETLSVDLTGGFDSRLVACLLRGAGAKFESALSGSPDLADRKIASAVASKLGVPFFFYAPPVKLSPGEFEKVFDWTDGMADALYFRRIAGLQRTRAERGVTLAISGMGGALFKDVFWLHEFPFYWKRRSNTTRWFDLRMMPQSKTKGILTDRLEPLIQNMRLDFINRLNRHVSELNTLTYDKLGYFVKYQTFSGVNLTSRSRVGPLSYDPLLEFDVFRISYNLPRMQRVFNSVHRRLISKYCPYIAEIVTTEGFAPTTRIGGLPKSAIGYSHNKARRIIRKVAQRLGSQTVFAPASPDDPLIASGVRESAEFAVDVAYLKSLDVLDQGIVAEKVRTDIVGRMRTVAHLCRRLS
jgi:hypothetical protein